MRRGIVTVIVLLALVGVHPFFAHAAYFCGGMGDNTISFGGGGVSVQCSKYETPGGGKTQYAMPDGTQCSFENTSPNDISCKGKPGDTEPIKKVTPSELKDLVADAIKSIRVNPDSANGAITGGSIIESAYLAQDSATSTTLVIPYEDGLAAYDTLLSLIQQSASSSDAARSKNATTTINLQGLSDSVGWDMALWIAELKRSKQKPENQLVLPPFSPPPVLSTFGSSGGEGCVGSVCDTEPDSTVQFVLSAIVIGGIFVFIFALNRFVRETEAETREKRRAGATKLSRYRATNLHQPRQ